VSNVLKLEARKSRAALMTNLRECRRTANSKLEIRLTADGKLELSGYASVFNVEYDMGWYTEIVRTGAFTKTLAGRPDVQLLVNHEGLPLARTKSETLELSEDDYGLKVMGQLDAEDPDAQNLKRKMDRGDLDEMSFGFWTIRQQWDEDYEVRELLEVRIDRGDVSVVNFGANPSTSVTLRSSDILSRMAMLDPTEALVEMRAAGTDPVKLVEQARGTLDRIQASVKPTELNARAYTDALAELRGGKTLSTETMATLQSVLDNIAAADENVDEAQETLSELMGVDNPDPDKLGQDANDLMMHAKARQRHRISA
jgi:HK97 family phage prohead protease